MCTSCETFSSSCFHWVYLHRTQKPLQPACTKSLSFALTNNLTIVGMNFGLLKREARHSSHRVTQPWRVDSWLFETL